jgi:protein tyrosine phosphatase (PTP) superfamily phosphohydrolase (DUF442 family)
MDDPLREIPAFLRLSERVATSGQPTTEQLAEIAEAGFETVVNLALPTSPGAIADEAELLAAHGVEYVPIPIDFRSPDLPSALRFFETLRARRDRRIFVHCAKNMRVSALMYAYRVAEEGVPPTEARRALLEIWQPDETWARYIERVIAAARAGRSGAQPRTSTSASVATKKATET